MDVEIPEEDLLVARQGPRRPRLLLPRRARGDDLGGDGRVGRRAGPLVLARTGGPDDRREDQERGGSDAGAVDAQGAYQIGEVQARSWMTGSWRSLQQGS